MKLLHTITFVFFLPIIALAEERIDRFYVWQQLWSTNVLSAVANEPTTTIYPVAAVVPEQGSTRPVDIPWKQLAALKHHVVPTIRIPLDAFKRDDIAKELSRITKMLQQNAKPISFNEIQFDLDCPERLIPEYTKLVSQYRQKQPTLRLSITALPCHLNNSTFKPLAQATDNYVLQVHGLEIPNHIDDPSSLLDLKTAERAIRQAEALGHPYHIALPCYAYELNFDADSGNFLYLTAEGSSPKSNTIKKRIAADQTDLIALQKKLPELKHAQGIIWFRLPVEGDRLCTPRADLKELQNGIKTTAAATCRVQRISHSTVELELTNENAIQATTAVLHIDWPKPIGIFDLYQRISTGSILPDQLPTELTVPLPGPGELIKIGWFETSKPPTINIKLQ